MIGPREVVPTPDGEPNPIAHTRMINGKEFMFIRLLSCPRTVVAIETGDNGSVRHEWKDTEFRNCGHPHRST